MHVSAIENFTPFFPGQAF